MLCQLTTCLQESKKRRKEEVRCFQLLLLQYHATMFYSMCGKMIDHYKNIFQITEFSDDLLSFITNSEFISDCDISLENWFVDS